MMLECVWLMTAKGISTLKHHVVLKGLSGMSYLQAAALVHHDGRIINTKPLGIMLPSKG